MKAALAGALLGVSYPDISDVLVQVEALLLPGEIEQRPLRLHLQYRLKQRAALGGKQAFVSWLALTLTLKQHSSMDGVVA